MEKEIQKESKAEEGAVKQILKDLSRVEKEVRKAQKVGSTYFITIRIL
jgi:putative IMPACT (imprinted ancient) family translation regulator